MKKILFVIIPLLLFMALALPIYSQDAPLITKSSSSDKKIPGRNELMPLKQATSPSELMTPPGMITSMEILIAKINKAVELIRNIQERITSRLEKMKSNNLKTDKIDSIIGSVNIQIQKLESDLTIEKKLQKSLRENSDRKIDYKAWRKQVVVVRQDINDVLKLQKNIIIEMKKLAITP